MVMSCLARLVLCVGLLAGPGVRAADFDLTADETVRVERGETVIRADLDAAQRRGTVRAALLVNATPEVIFEAMTRCDEALEYVPHLRHCEVLPQGADGSSRLVEHEIDLGWYAPRFRYVFRADIVTDRRIAFRQVTGDFKVNEGVWEFEPAGLRTLIRYRISLDPPAYVPTWLARSTFRRELPKMLGDLRRHCESEQRQRTHANIFLSRPHLD